MKSTVLYRRIASSDRKEEIMATAKQLVLIEKLDIETRRCGLRQFVNAQRQNIAGQDDEAALVLAAKSGDGHAFEILIERHQRRMLAVARRFARIREDAEDIVQQSFQKAFVHLHKFEGKSSLSTWLTQSQSTKPLCGCAEVTVCARYRSTI
jgi:Sigma-70 region 2